MRFGSFLLFAEILLLNGNVVKTHSSPLYCKDDKHLSNATVQRFGWEGGCAAESEPGDQPIRAECTFFGGEKQTVLHFFKCSVISFPHREGFFVPPFSNSGVIKERGTQ